MLDFDACLGLMPWFGCCLSILIFIRRPPPIYMPDECPGTRDHQNPSLHTTDIHTVNPTKSVWVRHWHCNPLSTPPSVLITDVVNSFGTKPLRKDLWVTPYMSYFSLLISCIWVTSYIYFSPTILTCMGVLQTWHRFLLIYLVYVLFHTWHTLISCT